MKTDRIDLRVTAATRETLVEAAEGDGRTLSDYVRRLLESYAAQLKQKAVQPQ